MASNNKLKDRVPPTWEDQMLLEGALFRAGGVPPLDQAQALFEGKLFHAGGVRIRSRPINSRREQVRIFIDVDKLMEMLKEAFAESDREEGEGGAQ